MTWQNLPCAPTLPALFAACPHGWAEIEFTYHAGNPTADPPQDADFSLKIRRLWGIENTDEPALVDLLDDLQEPPLGMPKSDCTLLARVVHRAGPCNACGRQRGASETGWSCHQGEWTDAAEACYGVFPFECVLETCWGVDGKPVVFVGGTPIYGLAAALDHKAATTAMLGERVPGGDPVGSIRCICGCLFVVAQFDGVCPRCTRRTDDSYVDDCDTNTPRGG